MRMTMRRRPHGKFALEREKKEGERVVEGRRLGKLSSGAATAKEGRESRDGTDARAKTL